MKRNARRAGLSAVLLAAGTVSFSSIARFTAKTVRKQAENRLREALQRPVTVGAVIGNPFIGFTLRDVRVEDPQPGAPPLLTVKALQIRISLKKIVRLKLIFNHAFLDQPELNLVRDENGEWNALKALRTLQENIRQGIQDQARDAKKHESRAEAAVRIEKARVRDGRIAIHLHRPAETRVIHIESLKADVFPPGEGRGNLWTGSAIGESGGIPFQAGGTVENGQDGPVFLDWTVGPADLRLMENLDRSIGQTIEKLGWNGEIQAKGSIRGTLSSVTVEGAVTAEEFRMRSEGPGKMEGRFSASPSGVRFEGTLNLNEEEEASFAGSADFDGEGRINLSAEGKFEASDAGRAIDLFISDMDRFPFGLKGRASGTFSAAGRLGETEGISSFFNVRIANGRLRHPTPSFREKEWSRAFLAFDRLDFKAAHDAKALTIPFFSISGAGLEGNGSGALEYDADELKPGRIPGPYRLSINLQSPDIAILLRQNSHLGPFVSGETHLDLALSGWAGRSETIKGLGRVELLKGTASNPYDETAVRLPLDVTLSRFAVDRFHMEGALANRAWRADTFSIRSRILELEGYGSLDFDGALDGTAGALMKPEILMTVDALSEFRKAFDNMGKSNRVGVRFDLGGTIQRPSIKWRIPDFIRGRTGDAVSDAAEKLFDKAAENLDFKIGRRMFDRSRETLKDALERLRRLI